ncbi:hypothetical protein D3C75_477490 [compost metagenome]
MDAQGLGHHVGAATIVAGQQMAADVSCAQLLHRLQRAGLEGVTKGEQAQHVGFGGLFDQPGQGPAFFFPRDRRVGQRPGTQAAVFQQTPIAQRQATPFEVAGDAATSQGLAVADIGHLQSTLGTGIQNSLGQRMLTAALQGAGQLQQARLITVDGTQMSNARGAGGQGAGLVEHHRAHFMGPLQCFGVLDQNSVACRHAGAGHDRRRCGQAQRAWAGDHQHRHGIDQCGFHRRAIQPPADQGGQGNQQHGGHEHLADFIHQFLDRRFCGLGVFHQPDDPRQHGFRTEGLGTHQQPAFTVDRAAGDLVAGLLGHWQTLAADQGFVGVALTFNHFAIHREAFAGFDHHQVIEAQGADGDVLLVAIDHPDRPFRAQGFEGTDGAGGLALGAAFQVLAQQYQGDHHRRGFEIQMRHAPGGGGPFVQAQAIPGAGAQGDQQIHVAGPGAHGFPGGDVKPCAEDELHRSGQGELRPGREHPVHAEWL